MTIWFVVAAGYYLELLYYMATNPGVTCQSLGNGAYGCTGSW
jgi:hypothetical protein